MSSDISGATFMQLNEKCDHCQDRHWINSWYIFVAKTGPLKFGFSHRGAYAVKVENISNLSQSVIDEKLRQFDVEDIEYGACTHCAPNHRHVHSRQEFCDFGIVEPFQSDHNTSDTPENNFLDSTRGTTNQSELFRDSTLEGLSTYIGSITVDAQIVPLYTINETHEEDEPVKMSV